MPYPNEFEAFHDRVNRNDYTQHKVFLFAAIASMVLGVVLFNAVLKLPIAGFALGVPFLVMSAVRARTGGKSAVSPDDDICLDRLSPSQRRAQANHAIIGAFLITAAEIWFDYHIIRARLAMDAAAAQHPDRGADQSAQ